ncbi:hypothetical protein Pcinc_027562 [Petrolisthes cinctipes]|uniref:Large ribosomal subunit protein mL43 n=1 Tax=Petrolisthes cinctipes TaxID=88211 RepID=A0AAE1K8M5_PETCI|nr:hypothetical protein Pcinc_027562 [Petrolisthes cinctipes]
MTTKTWRLFWGSGPARVPLQNGVGRYVQQLQRITFKFCKTHGGSLGMREYIEKDLVEFARHNPGVVVYLKPRRHRSPCLKAEYLNGEDDYISTQKHTCEDIKKWVEYLRCRSGYPVEHLINYHHTDHPSIQGPWTPWLHRDHKLNVVQYPNEELSTAHKVKKTATEELMELYEKQKMLTEMEKTS